ncbi:MAG: AAA family ATPase [Planctomycetota bacterium]
MSAAAPPSAAALPWLTALTDPATYPHAVGAIELIHTHLSVVALTGEFAYKFKKPVNYGFADFSTLERRWEFCRAEVALNRRFAPELYLGVVRLVRTAAGWRLRPVDADATETELGRGETRVDAREPKVDASEPRVGDGAEPAVRMRQFAAGDCLDVMLAEGRLSPALIDDLAAVVAAMHHDLPPVSAAQAQDSPRRLAAALAENFACLPATAALRDMRRRCDDRLASLQPLLAARAAGGAVRDCHGDLHLQNLCLWRGRPTAFDCIEFNPALRRIDVLADAAFLFMDLCVRGRRDLALRWLDGYLAATGDYTGLPAWPLWVAYRAMVRAKIAHLTLSAPGVPADRQTELAARRENCLALADETLREHPVALAVMVGLPGSGKSTRAMELVQTLPGGGLRLRSDVERARMFPAVALAGAAGVPPNDVPSPSSGRGAAAARSDAGSDLAPAKEKYSAAATEKVYARLRELAGAVLAGGFSAILDATHLTRAQRAAAIARGWAASVPVRLVHCTGSDAELRARLAARGASRTTRPDGAIGAAEPSEADAAVLALLAPRFEPFTAEELRLLG